MTIKILLRTGSLLTLLVLLSYTALAQTQGGKVKRRSHQANATAVVGTDTATSSKAGSEDKVEQLQTKVEQLQTLVEQQQRALAEMQKSIEALTSKSPVLTPASAQIPSADAQTLAPLVATEATQTNKSAPSSSPAQKGSGEKLAFTAGWEPANEKWDKSHAFIRSADGRFEAALTGYAQLDYRGYESGNHPPNTFLIRRARLALEGKLDRYFDFKVEGDFADTTSIILRDFYLNVKRVDELQFRFGHFKEPFSQEELRGDAVQDFVERSLVNNLAPSRSPGLMVWGKVAKERFEYYAGMFNGKGPLAQNNNGTPESVVRLRFAPWKGGDGFFTKGLAFGGAYAQGRSFDGTGVRGRTESQSITFYSPDLINGKTTRANGELTWLLGPLAIRAEYDQTNQEREDLGPNDRDLPGVVAKGYMAQATYLLTGERKPDNEPVAPRHNLFGEKNGGAGLGAWELKFRYSNLQVSNGTAKSNRAETFLFGPNWYLTRYVRQVFDFGFERFKDRVRSPNPNDRYFFVVLSRIQVAF